MRVIYWRLVITGVLLAAIALFGVRVQGVAHDTATQRPPIH